jgi:ParB family transcriptional regulator, chromosome partitioning protein
MRAALQAEFVRLEDEYAQTDEVPEKIERRFAEIEAPLEALGNRPVQSTGRRSRWPAPSSA